MKICFASRRPVFPFIRNGADVSFYLMAELLAKRNHHVLLLGQLTKKDFIRIFPDNKINNFKISQTIKISDFGHLTLPEKHIIEIHYDYNLHAKCTLLSDWNEYINYTIDAFNPDILITQLDGTLEIIKRCEASSLPIVHFIRDTINPINILPYIDTHTQFSGSILTIANSQYTADWFEKMTNKKCEIIYPYIPKLFWFNGKLNNRPLY